jgi:hypothetical protein
MYWGVSGRIGDISGCIRDVLGRIQEYRDGAYRRMNMLVKVNKIIRYAM